MTNLGIDLGSNSIGWALIDDEKNQILDIGSRVFEAGVNDLNTGKESSKNAQRSLARRARRLYRRRSYRIKQLKKVLKEIGMMPLAANEGFFNMNPYNVRSKGLHQKLELYEIGRAFYHICQRRGFKSNRKQKLDESEKTVIYEGAKDGQTLGINQTIESMKAGNFLTLGEYLASLVPSEQKLRSRYTTREMYNEEFNKIWESQMKYYPEIMNESNYKRIAEQTIFFQNPLKTQKHLVGICKFENKMLNGKRVGKKRIPKSSPLFQEFRMYQQINQLRIYGPDRYSEETQELTGAERERLIKALSEKGDIKFKDLPKTLGLDKSKKYSFNTEHLDKLFGLRTIVQMKKALGEKKFNSLTESQVDMVWHTISFADDNVWLNEYLQVKLGFTAEEAEQLSKINLEPKYGNLSKKAINKIIPWLREGYQYHEACEKAGYSHSLWDEEVEQLDRLPIPEDVRNPIVLIALHQLRKVINSLIDKYGKPDTIRIEMARDMKLPLKKRLEILKNNKTMQNKHDEIREILKKELNFDEPKRNDITKYKLWEECKQICPYTGKTISLKQLYSPEVEIEHIIPFSRSLDNSYMNLSLCFTEENKNKSNRTPYEAYSYDNVRYKEILERVRDFPVGKAKRFSQKEIDTDEFVSTQLNDTRYISRVALSYLKYVCEDIQVGKGQLTSLLRYLWGLDSILHEESFEDTDPLNLNEKKRADHRHHAIDAAVIALTTRSLLIKLSQVYKDWGFSDETKEMIKDTFHEPWHNFRSDLRFAVSNIIVSHKFKNNLNGKLHEETNYGRLKTPDGEWMTDEKGNSVFAIRKPLTYYSTIKQIREIIEFEVREAIFLKLLQMGVDINNPKATVPKEFYRTPTYLEGSKTGKKTIIKSARKIVVSSAMKNIRNYNLWVEPGNNHHLIIYIDENGKRRSKTVTLMEVRDRIKRKLSVIDKVIGPNCEFIASLQQNEMFIYGEIPENFDINDKSTYHKISGSIYRVQKFDVNGNITLRRHEVSKLEIDFDDKTLYPGRLICVANTFKLRKIVVDEIGFIHYAGD